MPNYISKIILNNNEYQLKDSVARQLIEELTPGFKTIIASSLPQASKDYLNTLVLVAKDQGAPESGTYIEYICYETTSPGIYDFEQIGTTDVDLTDYVKKENLIPITVKTVAPKAAFEVETNTLLLDFSNVTEYQLLQLKK